MPSSEVRVAVLFSGGLDCTILARMCDDLLPSSEPIDLLNVAFENPRIHSNLEPGASPYELCPDRITGRSSHAELTEVCPGRDWRFVEVNVPYVETQAQRKTVLALMHPHNTEMDLSISYALYFASRGVGLARTSHDAPAQPYTTTAHVLLSGLGADELFGGYQRHAVAFARREYPGLIEELELDFSRLGKRNLGRDDPARRLYPRAGRCRARGGRLDGAGLHRLGRDLGRHGRDRRGRADLGPAKGMERAARRGAGHVLRSRAGAAGGHQLGQLCAGPQEVARDHEGL